jgi:hypothetical protein
VREPLKAARRSLTRHLIPESVPVDTFSAGVERCCTWQTCLFVAIRGGECLCLVADIQGRGRWRSFAML